MPFSKKIIIGVDPGLASVGYGVVSRIQNNKFKCLGYGLIQTDHSLATTKRLEKIYNELGKLIKKHKPDILAVENVYFFKNLKTALPVSQAKGVILLTAAKNNIPIKEFTPLQVKMGVTGYGRAEKKQVQKMIQYLLSLKDIPEPDDAADALAVAVCCGRALDRGL